MIDLTMPRLSDSMEEGTILSWLVADGEPVAVGDDLVEIETDKATMTHTADVDGILAIVAPAGTTLAVGDLIARVGERGEHAPPPPPSGEPAEAPAAVAGAAPVAVSAVASGSRPVAVSVNGAASTPLARRIAQAHDIPLDRLSGSGPRGRITRADVLAAAGIDAPAPRTVRAAPPAAPAVAPVAAPPRDPARGAVTEQEPTRLQALIARRMVEAKATVPEFQVQTEVAMDAAIALRAELKAAARDGDAVPSFNDLIVKAAALALRRHPRANGAYRDGRFDLHERVNVGVAVAADDALVVPTVFDADTKSLGQIARDVRALAGRVRAGEIRPADLEGGTFTVSNLGMYGMSAITPVINAPQAGILGVGALREVLARVDGEVVDRTLMTLTLTCDHRILYGADAARFLAEIRELLELPLRIAL
jgi:pyruvate dehydrogenase E2 component (dihydrolipoamide acetyltransferase)